MSVAPPARIAFALTVCVVFLTTAVVGGGYADAQEDRAVRAIPPGLGGDTALFRIPVGGPGVTYEGVDVPEALGTGPSALAAAADGSIWIADPDGRRLLHYGRGGKRIGQVLLPASVIGVRDIEVAAQGIWVLDVAATTPQVVQLSSSGDIIQRVDVRAPGAGTPGFGLFAANTGSLYLERDGAISAQLVDQRSAKGSQAGGLEGRPPHIDVVPTGTVESRNGLGYRLETASGKLATDDFAVLLRDPDVSGGARLLRVTATGTAFVLVENAEVRHGRIHVKQTVRAVNPDGSIIADYDVPLDEQYVYVEHPVSVAMSGQVYALITQPRYVEVRQLIARSPTGIRLTPLKELSVARAQPVPAGSTSAQPNSLASCMSWETMQSNARDYYYNRIYYSDENINGSCSGRGKPRYFGAPGFYYSVAYDWNGGDSVSSYNWYMVQEDEQAGDIDTEILTYHVGLKCHVRRRGPRTAGGARNRGIASQCR